MKKLSFLITICSAIALLSSCKKSVPDPGPAPCNTICNNGGKVSQNCGCDCPGGFTGANCQIELPIVSVIITRVIVNHFPASTSTGYNWDPGTTSSKYPDIFLNINMGTTSTTTQTSAIYMDVNSAPQIYSLVPVTLYNPSSNYSIGLYDYDGISDPADFMGGIYFKPINFKNGYPKTIHLSNASGTIDYTVYVIWNF